MAESFKFSTEMVVDDLVRVINHLADGPVHVEYMAEHGMRDWARVTMPARLGQNTDPRCVDWWVDMMGATAMSTARAYLKWVVTTEPRLDLPKISCPTLVILTRLSQETNAVGGGQLEPEVVRHDAPHAEILVLDMDCYHASGADPDTCAQAARKFLDGLRGA